MNVTLDPEINAKVLSALTKADKPALAAPDNVDDPYYGAGCHPDIVERVWDQIGAAYPSGGRCLVYGRPALADPGSRIIVAVGYGTAYCVRIPVAAIPLALHLGATFVRKWTGGEVTDIQSEFGEGWVFGAWLNQEIEWTKAACELWFGK